MITQAYTTPGIAYNYTSQSRNAFYGNRRFAAYIPLPTVIDGTLSSNPLNTPYTWLLWAGTPMGQVTATQKWRNSIIGLTTGAYTSGGTSLTVSAATATEINRLIGLNGSTALNIYGPPTTAGTGALLTTTASAASGTTVTLTNLGANVVAGSIIMPADGSQTITSLLCDDTNVQIVDAIYTTRVDAANGMLLAGGTVVINSGMIPNFSSMDTSVQTYVAKALESAMPGVRLQNFWLSPSIG